MGSNDDRRTRKGGKWMGLVLVLLFTQPALVIPLAFFGGIVWLAIQAVKKQQGSAGRPAPRETARYTTRQKSFDECPQSIFCRHRDKAVHHIRRGREIDPWDRPDIDISKYQRNR